MSAHSKTGEPHNELSLRDRQRMEWRSRTLRQICALVPDSSQHAQVFELFVVALTLAEYEGTLESGRLLECIFRELRKDKPRTITPAFEETMLQAIKELACKNQASSLELLYAANRSSNRE